MKVSFTIPIRTVSESNVHEHWMKRYRRSNSQRGVACAITCLEVPRHSTPTKIVLTRLAPKMLDTDNLVGAFKAVRDGIANGLQVDDGDPRITWVYRQRQHDDYAVEVEIHTQEAK